MRGYPAPPRAGGALERCPTCASERLEYEFRIDDGVRVWRCADCDLLFVRERGDAPPPAERDYTAHVAERVAHLRSETGAAPRSVLAVVPAGAFAGVPGVDVVTADAAERAAPAGRYDALVAVDALDRVADPEALLANLRDALPPGAPASFTVRSVDSTSARYAGTAWHGFRSGAFAFYGVDTLQSLLVKHGFREPRTYPDGRMRRGSLRVRAAGFMLRAVALRERAASAQRGSGLLDDGLTLLTRRGELIDRPRLSVIVPVYNERATFRELMSRLVAKELDGVDIEIIIVESNSTDGSREEVVAFAGHPRVTVVLQDRPSGKGNAVRAGLARATGDIVLFQDADLEYEIDDYDDLVRPIRAYQRNFVIGSRHVKGSAWKIRDFNDAPLLSQVFNLGHVAFLGMLNTLYGQSLDDPFSMFKVFRRDCIAGLRFECDRFDFDFEIVIKLLRKGYQPIEIPVNYHSRSLAEGKKVTMVRDPITWLRALVKFRASPIYAATPAEAEPPPFR